VKLRARWIGPRPRAGDYLMSEVRPRFAYRITQVTSMSPYVTWDQGAKAEVHQLQFVVDRIARAAVPKHATIHPWKWDKREARKTSRQHATREMQRRHAA
jgi:hypothetical protein